MPSGRCRFKTPTPSRVADFKFRSASGGFAPWWAKIIDAESPSATSLRQTYCGQIVGNRPSNSPSLYLHCGPAPLSTEGEQARHQQVQKSQFSPDGESLGTASPCLCWREGSEPGRLAQPHPRFVPSACHSRRRDVGSSPASGRHALILRSVSFALTGPRRGYRQLQHA